MSKTFRGSWRDGGYTKWRSEGRARCSVCDEVYKLRLDGMVRHHKPPRNGWMGFRCDGGGLPPAHLAGRTETEKIEMSNKEGRSGTDPDLASYFTPPSVAVSAKAAAPIQGRYQPAEGRHENVPNEVYHQSWDALNASRLSDLLRSPAYCKYRIDNPDAQAASAAMEFGTAVHCALLEPDRFESVYCVEPPVPASRIAEGKGKAGWSNTKDYKAQRQALEDEGKTIISEDNYEACLRIRERVFSAPSDTRDLLHLMTASEVSYVVRDAASGLLLKARVDLEAWEAGIICDIKTTRNAAPRPFSRTIADLGYARSNAFYRRVLEQAAPGRFHTHLILAITNTPPWEDVIYSLDAESMRHGEEEADRLIDVYRRCLDGDTWPGLPRKVQPIGLPAWAFYVEPSGFEMEEGEA